MRVLNEQEVRAAVGYDALVAAVERAFAELARGAAQLPAVMSFGFPDAGGEAHVKGAYLAGAPYYVVKVASGFYANPARGLPVGAGLVLAFSAATGRPEALLLDNGCLTDMRTGAAGAVAAKYLARDQLAKVAVIGSGVQARCQLRALRSVRVLPSVSVWSRSQDRSADFAKEMSAELDAEIRPARSVEEAVAGADLVITATASPTPLVRGDWLAAGAHVTAVGSDMPAKRELDATVLERADVIVADSLAQCLEAGELHHAVDDGLLSLEDIAGELGDLILGRIAGRTCGDQVTVCDLTGVGVQDAAAAALVMEHAAAQGIGRELAL
jgi:ornithine cyclodeaminase/alanine dehydrogenase-like protein (mu-crystallin family)